MLALQTVRLIVLCCLLPATFLFSVVSVAAEVQSSNLIADHRFARGVRVVPPVVIRNDAFSKPARRTVATCFPQRDCSKQPVWQLQQWGSAQDIAAGKTEQSLWVLHDEAGRMQKSIQISSGDPVAGDVRLEINGLSEFSALDEKRAARYLQDLGSVWPHWLLSQQLSGGRLAQYSQLLLDGQLKLLFDKQQRQDGYSPNLHAARLLLAMTIRSRLTGDYFWLTLPLYDDRFTQSDFGCQKCIANKQCAIPRSLDDPGRWLCPEDKSGEQWWLNDKTGTARMIFRMPTWGFFLGEAKSGGWVPIRGDLMPYIKAGIEAVRQRDGGERFPANLFFYEIGLFSIGWEITGFNHVAVQLRDWRLDAVRQTSVVESP